MKQLLNNIMSRNSYAYKIIWKWRRWYKNLWSFDVLHSYVIYKSDIYFIQIGSNDGKHGDPIFNYIKKYGWKGILVEPVPYLFDRLKSNYANLNNNLFFENSAIANESGMLKFYRLKESNLPNLPVWYDQLGSFKKEVVLRHRDVIPSFDDLLMEDTVNAITFKELLEKYKIKKLDLIHIDTEGYDYEIIKMIPFAEIEIDLVMFEHKHLSNLEYKKAVKLLHSHGFKVHKKGPSDTIAVKKHLLNTIISANKSIAASRAGD